jgi:DNA-directed RNA polymerase specialized sigma24 family protein
VSEVPAPDPEPLPESLARRVDQVCNRCEAAWKAAMLPRLDCLWGLLVTITARKAARQVRDETSRKRRGAAPVADADAILAEALSRGPSPEFAAGVAEECRRLVARLGDQDLQAVALLRLEGYSVAEVAGRLGCAPRTVKRKLALIRTVWEKETPP